MDVLHQSECIQYRMIVFRNAGSEVLLLCDASSLRLPWVELRCSQRPAEIMCCSLQSEWNCYAVCLFGIDIATQIHVSSSVRYQAMECFGHHDSAGNAARWLPVDSMSAGRFADLADYEAVRRSLIDYENYSNGLAPGTFAKPGWFADLRQWVQASIRPMGLELRDSFCQFNASPTFSLLRLETSGPAVWFKAVGEPNSREFPIAVALSELFPKHTPSIIATKPECNGWLSLEASGAPLEEIQRAGDWEAAAAALAQLQIESIGKSDRLLRSGARDLRISALDDLVEPFIAAASELMEQQVKVPPPILHHQELAELGKQIHAAIARLDGLNFPESLGHLDINPGNIIVSAASCAFLDWAEAYIGPPFFTFQYLLEHLRRSNSDSPLQTRVVALYAEQWRGVAALPNIEDALSLVPLLAAFAYAAGSGAWSDEMKLRNPESAGYVRSLVRRMRREATELVDRRLPCLSL